MVFVVSPARDSVGWSHSDVIKGGGEKERVETEEVGMKDKFTFL